MHFEAPLREDRVDESAIASALSLIYNEERSPSEAGAEMARLGLKLLSSDLQPQTAATENAIWYLSQMSTNSELMHAASQLFMHLMSQVHRAHAVRRLEWEAVTMRQERELAAMLEAADQQWAASTSPSPADRTPPSSGGKSGVVMSSFGSMSSTTSSSCIVRSRTTAGLVAKHQADLDALNARHMAARAHSIQQAAANFLSFVKTAAPQYLLRLEGVLARIDSGINSNELSVAKSLPVCAFNSLPHPVDVVVFKVVNPLRGAVVGARPKDPSLAAIVLEASPLDRLREINALAFTFVPERNKPRRHVPRRKSREELTPPPSSSESDCPVVSVDEAEQERMAAKVLDHLMRLSTSQHSMLVVLVPDSSWSSNSGSCRPVIDEHEAQFFESIGVSQLDEATMSATESDALPEMVPAPEILLGDVKLAASCAGSNPYVASLSWAPLLGGRTEPGRIHYAVTSTTYAGNIIARVSVPIPSRTAQPQQASGVWDPAVYLPLAFADVWHLALRECVTRVSVAVTPEWANCIFSGSGWLGGEASNGVKLTGKAWMLRGLHEAIASVQLELFSAGARHELSCCGSPGSAFHAAHLAFRGGPGGKSTSIGSLSHHAAGIATSVPCTPRTFFNTPCAVRFFVPLAPDEPLEASAAEAFGRDVEVIGRTCSAD